VTFRARSFQCGSKPAETRIRSGWNHSAGFDPHWNDLALNVTYEGFGALTGRLQALARRHCRGRLAFVLEGGYNLVSLPRGVHAVLEVLAGGEPPVPGISGVAEVAAAAAYHRDAFISPDE